MRCNLDGSGKEEMFQYQYTLDQYWIKAENLKIDGDYIYLAGEYGGAYGLARIPLYGGKIEGVTKNIGHHYFDISDDGVFFMDFYDKYICRVDKDLSGTPTAVAEVHYCEYGSFSMASYPFQCAGGHLMVQAANKKKRKIADKVYDYAGFLEKWDLWVDVQSFAPDYYWMTEEGEMEDTIKGSGVKKKWKKIAAKWKYDD